MGEKKERKYHDGVLQRLELLENNLWNQENKCSKEIPDQEKSLQEQISLEKRIMDELKAGCLLIHIEEECQRQFFSIRSAKGKRNRIGKFRNVLYDWRNMEMSVV